MTDPRPQLIADYAGSLAARTTAIAVLVEARHVVAAAESLLGAARLAVTHAEIEVAHADRAHDGITEQCRAEGIDPATISTLGRA